LILDETFGILDGHFFNQNFDQNFDFYQDFDFLPKFWIINSWG